MAKLKFIGKQSIRANDLDGKEVNLHTGESYDESALTGDYLKALVAQNFFEVIAEKKSVTPTPTEISQTPKADK